MHNKTLHLTARLLRSLSARDLCCYVHVISILQRHARKRWANFLEEVFGHLTTDQTDRAERYRPGRLCPFNNKVPNCTKDKAKNPLGVFTRNPIL